MTRTSDLPTSGKLDERLLGQQVQELVARLHPAVTLERRHDDRVPMPVLFRLTPLNENHEPVHDDAIVVVGKNISRRGLSFFHQHPLTYRRAIVSLEYPEFGRFSAEIDVSWCRFTKPGWYESGGRLVRPTVPLPTPVVHLPETTAWSLVPLAGSDQA